MNDKKTSFFILQISDLHFGELSGAKKETFCHYWKPEETKDTFVSLCHRALRDAGIEPDFVVLCGDMVCCGADPEQHTKAAEAVIELCEGFSTFKTGQDSWARLLVVPGNHEVDRDEPTRNLRLSKHAEKFLREVYAKANVDIQQTRIPIAQPVVGYAPENTTWPRVVTIPDYPVEFVFLYSPVLDEDMLLPSEVKQFLTKIPDNVLDADGAKLKRDLPWSFDRGFVGPEQVAALEMALGINARAPNTLRIALTHHNVFPICRKTTKTDQHRFPDVHLLANGSEVVNLLIRMGVDVILHGHRHEGALRLHSHENVDHALTLVGAPTAGLREAAMRHETLGFNVLHVIHTNLGWRCRVIPFQFRSHDQILGFRAETQVTGQHDGGANAQEFVPLSREREPYELLTSMHGVERLASLLESSATGPTILHFTVKANWFSHNSKTTGIMPCGEGTPFHQVWCSPATNPDVRGALARTVGIWYADSQDAKQFNDDLKETVSRGRVASGLIQRLRAHTEKLTLTSLKSRPRDPFAQHILKDVRCWQRRDDPVRLDRRVNYALELYRLAVDEYFKVVKCIHICPVRFDTAKYGKRWAEASRVKFNWLVNSVFASAGLTNCSLSWMPFCFHERFNQTLVSIDCGHPSNGDPRGILIGWGPGEEYDGPADENLEDDHDYSVFQWHEEQIETGIWAVGRDIRGCLEKVIHPLAQRLGADFPLLRDGKVYVENLKHVARVCACEAEADEIDRYSMELPPEIIERSKRVDQSLLASLFNWVLSDEVMEEVRSSDGVLPWLEKDYELALKGCR